MSRLAGLLSNMGAGEVRRLEPLAAHTSLRIGGPAEVLFFPMDQSGLREAIRLARGEGAPVYLLGRGSNLLVADEGVAGLVLSLRHLPEGIRMEGERVTAGAGIAMGRLVSSTLEAGLTGLAFAAGIPGTLGGAVVMNAGAHGGEMREVLERVTVLEPDGGLRDLLPEEMGFAYRTSRLQNQGAMVLSAVLRLRRGDVTAERERMAQILARRRSTQPLTFPNAGSIFKNPPGSSAGALIEQAGGKGRHMGGAQISPLHANFIVNLGGAHARDVIGLMTWAREEVGTRFGVTLEPEIRYLGRNSQRGEEACPSWLSVAGPRFMGPSA